MAVQAYMSGIESYVLLTRKGEEILVDEDVYSRFRKKAVWVQYAWNGVPRVLTRVGGEEQVLARVIMGLPKRSSLTVDHRNRKPLDCRRFNMRIATSRVQTHNRSAYSSTGYKGVYPCRNKFRSKIVFRKKEIHLGVFATEIEAAKAYDKAARFWYPGTTATNFFTI